MSDTSAAISKMMQERYRLMTPLERWQVASSLFDTARRIVESSLPKDLTTEQRRLAIARRIHRTDLPEAALVAYSKFQLPS